MASGPTPSLRTRFFGITFSPFDGEKIADQVTAIESTPGFRMLVTANLDHVVQLRSNPAFRDAYDSAWLSTIDGSPVHLYVRLRGGKNLPRVTGADLLPLILDRLVPGRHRPFFVAARQVTADHLVAKLVKRGFSREDIRSAVPRHGFDSDLVASADLVAQIAAHRATHLFMGVGAPKSEIWMHRHSAELPPGYGFGFGAALEYAAGTRIRAPHPFRSLGIEWVWRVASDPRRLFHRYFIQSWPFIYAVLADLRSTGA